MMARCARKDLTALDLITICAIYRHLILVTTWSMHASFYTQDGENGDDDDETTAASDRTVVSVKGATTPPQKQAISRDLPRSPAIIAAHRLM